MDYFVKAESIYLDTSYSAFVFSPQAHIINLQIFAKATSDSLKRSDSIDS